MAGHNWQDFREYTYDANGNITSEFYGDTPYAEYSYDALNQLTNAVQNGNTYAYSHDNGGNILTKTTNGVTKHYSYTNANWKDQLTYYGSQSGSTTPNITYDAIGNPLTYYNGASFTWQGRQMQTAAYNGNNLEFRYNADGIRTRKIVNGAYTYYSVNGNNVVWQRTPNGIDAFFDYDAAGRAATMAYNGSTYYYVYNMQGDIIGLVDRNGDKMVEYTYDPYGKQLTCTGSLSSTIGQINPFRYRGYYYDAETGLYYLNSRYYDPETGRFLNADKTTDGQAGLIGLNLYAYAANNPIMNSDPTGQWIIKDAFKKVIKWAAKNITKPIVDTTKKVLPKLFKGTGQVGGTVTGAFGVSGTTSAGIAYDGKGNIGVTITGGGGGGSPSASACLYGTRTTAPTINKLEGISAQIGGSADALGVSVGAEMTALSDSISNQLYFGDTVMVGVGAPIPAELHGDVTYSKVYYINLFESVDALFNKIFEW